MPEYFGLYTNPRPETPSVGNSLSYGPVDFHRSEIPRPEFSLHLQIDCSCICNPSIALNVLLWCSGKCMMLLSEAIGSSSAYVDLRVLKFPLIPFSSISFPISGCVRVSDVSLSDS